MSHGKVNNIIAAAVFAIAFIVYWSTVAPTTSFWDCGEFIACSHILGVPHPPGAPFYILIGRFFSILSFLAEDVALRINLTSPLLSAFSSMFAYLIIVRLVIMWQNTPKNFIDKLSVYGAGIIGALAFTFSDSQWFNSVEAEVYAGSMFFTAIVVWLILKWMDHADSPYADRHVLIIFYLFGLALGVHLLNLLALPFVAMIIFARLYKPEQNFSFNEIFRLSLMAGVGTLALGFIYQVIVKGIPALMDNTSIVVVVLVFFALLIAAAATIRQNKRVISLVLMSTVLVAIGYSSYSIIFIRSNLDPVIDENNPETSEKFVSYLNREQYGDWSITEARAPRWEYQVKKMYLRYFGWQFIGKGTTLDNYGRIVENFSARGLYALPFLIGLLGFLYHFYKDWRRAYPLFVLFIMTGIAIVVYLNQEDPQPRERDYAYTGSFFAFALWIGIGVSAVIEFVRNLFAKDTDDDQLATAKSGATGNIFSLVVAGLLVVAIPGNMFSFNYHSHDRTGNYVAFDYSYNILQSCAPNAILFTNGDNDTFPLWFLQYVHKIRPDVRVVNLSLLNTPWYIKQLRDDEPKVPIRLPDARIERIQPERWETKTVTLPVPKYTYDSYYKDVVKIDSTIKYDDDPAIRIQVKPTLYDQAIRVQDLMILKILQDNQFKRPVYFAVTVSPSNKIGLDSYMRMDGLAFRVLPVQVNRRLIDPDLMWNTINDKFSYRNLNNPDVYYNDNILSLLQNYRSAFFQLIQFHLSRGEKEKALLALDRMSEVMPEAVIPTNNYRISEAIGFMYNQAGKPDEMDKRYKEIFSQESSNLPENRKLDFAKYFNSRGETAYAESLALNIIKKSPNYKDSYYWLGQLYTSQKQPDKAIDILEKWLLIDSSDATIQTNISKIRAQKEAQATPIIDTATEMSSDSAVNE